MKLVKMADEKIGIFVQLPNGAYAIDIAANLGFFLHDPLSYSLLNGALKDGHDWSLLVKHWADFACAFEETAENPARMSGPFADFAIPDGYSANCKRRQSDHRHRNYGYRDLRRAGSHRSAYDGEAVYVTSSERAATQLDGHENCASDRILFW